MAKLLSLYLLILALALCGQNNTGAATGPADKHNYFTDSAEYLQKCIDFIRAVKKEELSDSFFILADKPFSFEYFDCLKELSADTVTYAKDELDMILKKTYPAVSKWTTGLFPNIKMVSKDTLDVIFRDRSKWWPYYYQHVGRGYGSFSVPVFLRNGTYCLFYSDHLCGGLCGFGKLILYRKDGDKWVPVKSYCNWIS